MLKIVFNDGTKSLASFGLVSENIVSLNGAEQNSSGFKAYREKDDMFLGDYSDYTIRFLCMVFCAGFGIDS